MGKRAMAERAAAREKAEAKRASRVLERMPDPLAERKAQEALARTHKEFKAARDAYRSKKARQERHAEFLKMEREKRAMIKELAELNLHPGLAQRFFNLSSTIGSKEVFGILERGRLLGEEPGDDRVLEKWNPPYYMRNVKVYAVLEFQPSEEFKAIREGVTQLWHGTGSQGTLGITKEGFALPRGGMHLMLGPGIYTAPAISKASNYIKVTKGFGWMFLADVKLGTVLKTNKFGAGLAAYQQVQEYKADSAFAEKGVYKSAWGGSIQESEYATYDARRVHARYLFILKFPHNDDGRRW